MLAGTTQTFRLALKVAVDPAYEADAVLAGVETALREAYSFEARGFGEPVFRSGVVAVAHTVAGVLAVDVDRLYLGTTPGLADRLLAQQAGGRRRAAPRPGGRARARRGAVRLARGDDVTASTRPRSSIGCCRRSTACATPSRAGCCAS